MKERYWDWKNNHCRSMVVKEITWDWKNNRCRSMDNSCEEEPGTGRTITVGQWLIVVKERYWDWKKNHCRSMANSCEGKHMGL